MKLTVLNVIRRHGIGKNTDRPYDFAIITYIEPVESIETEKFHQEGHGYDTAEIPTTTEVLAQMKDRKFPGIMEFETDSRKTPRGFELVVIGVKS